MYPDPLDRLETAAEAVVRRAEESTTRTEYEVANRRGLLWVHALVGLAAGPQMALWGSANTIETTVGVWTRPVMAALGTAGGLLLALGLMHRPRSIHLEAAGLFVIAVWDLAMVVGLITARIHQHDYAIRPWGHPLPVGYVVAYPVPVYAGYLALLSIHLWTLRRLKMSGLKGGRK